MKILFAASLFSIWTTIQQCSERVPRHARFRSHRVEGNYYGMLPCSDCQAREINVELKRNQTYVVTIRYLGKDDNAFIEDAGPFNWVGDGTFIHLLGQKAVPYVQVQTTGLQILDENMSKVKGMGDFQYFLGKNPREQNNWAPYR